MSFAAGVSLAYAFLEVLPELARAERVLGQFGGVEEIRHPAYLVALLGVLIFYGLEILAAGSRKASTTRGRAEQTSTLVFAIHIGFFAIYSALIGELLVAIGERGLPVALLSLLALAFHFSIADKGMRRHHQAQYDRWGRWILAGALLAGNGFGHVGLLSPSMLSILWAFVAGGLILNTLKEELPESKRSCFISFFTGLVGFAALLLAV